MTPLRAQSDVPHHPAATCITCGLVFLTPWAAQEHYFQEGEHNTWSVPSEWMAASPGGLRAFMEHIRTNPSAPVNDLTERQITAMFNRSRKEQA